MTRTKTTRTQTLAEPEPTEDLDFDPPSRDQHGIQREPAGLHQREPTFYFDDLFPEWEPTKRTRILTMED